MPELSVGIVLWCGFALLCGGLIKGALGVGTPLLSVPFMALVLPPQTAIVLMVIPVLVANLWQFAQAPRVDNLVGRFWSSFVAILIGTWVGISILARIDGQSLLLVVGVAVILFSILQASSRKLRITAACEKPAGLIFGFASGVIGGISSFFGPMLVIYLVSLRDMNKRRFIGAISFLYLSAVVPWAITLYWVGILDQQLLLYSSIATTPVVFGMILGNKLRGFISEQRFQRFILAILLCSGGTILWRALG